MHEFLHVAKLIGETAAAIGGLILVGGVLLAVALFCLLRAQANEGKNPFQ